jgi:drug/metabolite transporter (DMT)-like permease
MGAMTPAPTARPSTAAIVGALLIVYVVWGSTYLAIAIMVETLPPLLAAGFRYATAGLIMFGAVMAYRRFRPPADPAERPTAAHWRSTLIIGTLLLLGGNGGVVLAELRIPSGLAAVLVATVPIWLAVFEAILTRRRPSLLVVGGLVAGIVGVGVLLVPVNGLEDIDPIGVVLVVGGTTCWAAGSLYARRAPLPRSGLMATGMEMIGGGMALAVGGILLGEPGRIAVESFSTRSLLAVAYLIVFGSIVAFTAYTWLLANTSVSVIGTYAYVNPIVAVGLGAVLLSEPITLRTVIATVIILGAVVAMVSGRPRIVEESGPDPEVACLEREGDGTDRATGSAT